METMYHKILDTKIKREIEFHSERWKVWPDFGNCSDYWILEQRNAEGKRTGAMKIIRKRHSYDDGFVRKKIRAKDERDWIYYVDRRRMKI